MITHSSHLLIVSRKLHPFRLSSSISKPKLILRSTSNNIHRNLALEDWFYQNHKFSSSQILYFYRNTPCVVIGRHQNPWTEANVPFLRRHSIDLARRNSGGGTVYHDLGNLNISFMTTKEEYSRVSNLELICAAIRSVMNVDVSINKRDDIVIDGERKISGTAAKLSRTGAYHHCTLLVNVDTSSLHEALNNPASGPEVIETNATRSVRSPVENLANIEAGVGDTERLILRIEEAISRQFSENEDIVNVNPNEENYAGLQKIVEGYESWDWIFGKSPKFIINTSDGSKYPVINGKIDFAEAKEEFSTELIDKLRQSHHNNEYKLLSQTIKDII